MSRVAVVGAGPAGLTAAHELDRLGHDVRVFERDAVVGGIARTVTYKGFRFDIGGHRFFTKLQPIQQFWEEVMGEDFLVRPRLSRIYYRGRFFDYPLRPINALAGLGAIESLRIVASYARAQLFPLAEERTFEQWVTNRFGRRLFEVFFKTYTEKVWGMSCSEIGADWAAQRIKNLDLASAVRNALLGSRGSKGGVVTTLIDRFHYPRLGPGMLWERVADRLVDRGVETVLEAEVVRVAHRQGRVREIEVRRCGAEERFEVDQLLSSMPIGDLVDAMDPVPPRDVVEAAHRLRHRDFLTVVLIVDEPELFPDNWIYIHAPEVQVGRIQNFKNWSPEMVPDPRMTSLGLEYFVQEGDDLWSAGDAELIELGTRETAELGLVDPASVVDGTVVRMPRAYPVYDAGYRAALGTIRGWMEGIDNLHSIGRNGQHRYNNQDHSMMTGLYAARLVDGADHDVWAVNVEPEYHEDGSVSDRSVAGAGRATPEPYVPTLEEALRSVFARYDPVALGIATGGVAGLGLFLATVVIVVRGQGDPGVALSLLGQYLLGYEVTWRGALIGLVSAGGAGFGFGFVLARMINRLIGWHESLLEHELEAFGTLDPLGEEP